ncbi:choice-of-anchor A family protein [Kitasatospora viridis]|uniref:Choice-of-anchor A domain-containing protein n=1 Tax=Kitasatospora viridis TaxID=281105 RepID=A0A561ULI6_9ACTN|nr:choice-of-anchor A family protein [Kitasatospora viridis]TWG00246.1 choice-of-anchor A domain-containing protein [Kitasatospora viridis]
MRHRGRSALLAAVAVAALAVLPGTHAAAVQLPPPLGPCGGPDCPSTWQPPNNGTIAGRDSNINVFVGGNYDATGRAAEVEGRIVTLGDFTLDKSGGGGGFNMGEVGVGSRVPPPNGSDFVSVGGNVTSRPGNHIIVGGPDAYGNLRYGGTLTGNITVEPTGQAVHDTGVRDEYAPLRDTIHTFSDCAAQQTATGTVAVTNSEATFTGDGTSARQVFNVTGNLASSSGGQIGLVFTNIPAGATVIVNMLSDAPVINTYTGTGQAGDQLTELRPKLLWNFPTASSATVTGSAQFQGSIMAGNPAGTTTLSQPGINGRVYLAGNLVQTSSGGGYEIHAYPFDGDLPECGTTPTPTPTPSPTESPTPSPSPTTPTASPTTPTASPTETVTASTSVSPSPSASETGETHSPRPTSSNSGELPDTGADDTGPLLGTVGGLLIAGGAAVLAGHQLTRRRGRHS